MIKDRQNRYVITITGASGSIYAERLIRFLLEAKKQVICLISSTGLKVVKEELNWDIDNRDAKDVGQRLRDIFFTNRDKLQYEDKQLIYYDNRDLLADIASGSNSIAAMIVIPCSMGTLARIAQGISSNLIERTADVCLKEKRPLIIVPRECPFNEIHIQNMLTLSRVGASIIPAMPAFYYHPKNIDELVGYVVGKVLSGLGIYHNLYEKWGEGE
ncbi:MAG: flavin prenyltransferase UbiX [bacterium]